MLTTITSAPPASSPAGQDQGIAMILVIASITVLTTLFAAAFTMALQAQPGARRSQDWNAALAAAQAGVDDYIARLNQSDTYWTTVDCTNPALKGPKAGTNSCGWNASTAAGWQFVKPGESDAGSSTTTWTRAALQRGRRPRHGDRQGADQLTVDPGARLARRLDRVPLLHRLRGRRPRQHPGVPDRAVVERVRQVRAVERRVLVGGQLWVHRDPLRLRRRARRRGPLQRHAADERFPRFLQGFETADPKCKTPSIANCRRGSGTPNLNGGQPRYAPLLYLPDNSSAFSGYPGCQYTGDTRIKFNSDGTMTVWSRDSAGTVVGAGCGTPALFAGGASQTIPVPNNKVIYVKNASSTAKCTTGRVGDGLPVANDVNTNTPTFYCGNGNVWVEGTLKGRTTLAAQNNIIVTDDLLIANTPKGSAATGPDMLGLVAANSVVNYHPVNSSGTNLKAAEDRWIYASIQTLQRSFWVQSYDEGAKLGTLHVRGSIAQRWRGIVGTGGASGTGYLKDYGYDSRLKFTSPPYFPQWTNAVWGAKTTAELTPQY